MKSRLVMFPMLALHGSNEVSKGENSSPCDGSPSTSTEASATKRGCCSEPNGGNSNISWNVHPYIPRENAPI